MNLNRNRANRIYWSIQQERKEEVPKKKKFNKNKRRKKVGSKIRVRQFERDYQNVI